MGELMFQINNDVSFKKFKRNEYIISVLFIGLVILFYLAGALTGEFNFLHH